jgi:hypothetical protein
MLCREGVLGARSGLACQRPVKFETRLVGGTPETPGPPVPSIVRHEILRLLATGQSELDENGELCVLHGRLYLASLAGLPVPTATTYFITLRKMRYMPFCADFGPFNLGQVPWRACARKGVR